MIPTKYLLDHIDALLRLSHDIKDRAASAKLREMADKIRIMVSVADITELAAGLNKASELNKIAPRAPDLISADARPDPKSPNPSAKGKSVQSNPHPPLRPVTRNPKEAHEHGKESLDCSS